MKKGIIIGGILVLIVVLIVVGNQNSSKKENQIKIGLSAPITGLPEYGEAFKNGVLMAIDDFDAENKGFKFVLEDNGYDSKQAISVFRKMVDLEDANIVFEWGTTPAEAVAPLVDNSDVLYFTISTNKDIAKNNDYVVRHFYNAEDQAEVLWKYFRENNYKNIAIIKLEIQFFDSIVKALEDQKRSDERVDVIERVAGFDQFDFRTPIFKMLNNSNEYDVLGVFVGAGQISQFYIQANELGLKIPTFGSDFFDSQTEINNSKGHMNGSVFPAYDVKEEFRRKYIEKYGNDVQLAFAANAYDLINFLVNEDIDYSNRDKILDSFRDKKGPFNGFVGDYIFFESEEDRYMKAPVVIKKIENNSIKVID